MNHKELEQNIHKFIVQPTGADQCPTCHHSGTPTIEVFEGVKKIGFSPALAYIDSE